jgi:hypothetical protein
MILILDGKRGPKTEQQVLSLSLSLSLSPDYASVLFCGVLINCIMIIQVSKT